MATDLILKGNLSLGGTDVSAECTEFLIKGTANDVVIPPTLATGTSHAGGARKYEITIGYLSDDSASTTLFRILWTAIGTASKELAFSGNFRDGANSTSNPNWSGTMVVNGADVGGDAEALSSGSITCTLTGAPTIATS